MKDNALGKCSPEENQELSSKSEVKPEHIKRIDELMAKTTRVLNEASGRVWRRRFDEKP
jgi:hypothetical protein